MTVVLPRLCLHPVDKETLISGHGPNIEWVKGGKIRNRLRVFDREGSHVFGIVPCRQNHALFVYGEKTVGYIPENVNSGILPVELLVKFSDTILAMKVLSKNQVVILFMSNLCTLFEFTEREGKLTLAEKESVQSNHIALMLHGILLGESWETLSIVAGTVFGEIFFSRPAYSSEVIKKMLGHTGMIFGLHKIGNLLFSISDDRSLRMWPYKDELDTKHENVPEYDCAFGHSARPFAITSFEGFIYTAGIDQLACKWKVSDDFKLTLVDQISVNTGGIRSLVYFNDALWIGSETGALLEVTFGKPSSNTVVPQTIPTCADIRGFGYLKNNLFTVNGKGNLFKNGEILFPNECLRYIVMSPSHYSDQSLIAFERKACAIFSPQNPDGVLISFSDSSLLAAVTTNAYVFMYRMDKIGVLYDFNGKLLHTISCDKSVSCLPKKISFLPSAMDVFEDSDSIKHLVVGSTCGHIIHCSLTSPEEEFEALTDISKRCAKGQIMSIQSFGQRIAIYCKNGSITCWSFKEGIFVASSVPLIRGSPSLDWPCGSYMFDGKEYIAEFHSTQFRLLDKNSGFAVLEFICGGGNRPWFFRLHMNKEGNILGTLIFIRKENLVEVCAGIHKVNYVADSLHVSQIISISSIQSCDDDVCVLTSGVDCQVTLSKINHSLEKITVIDKIATPDGITAVCPLCEFENRSKILLGSSKGVVSLWEISLDTKCDQYDLQVPCSYQHPDGTRVLDIMTNNVKESVSQCIAVLADGSIILLEVDLANSTFNLKSQINSPDYSLYTKGQLIGNRFYWVSTSGRIGIHDIQNQKFTHQQTISAVQCGISCLSVVNVGNLTIFVIGDESGCITAFKFNSEGVLQRLCLSYHCATVTEVRAYARDSRVFVVSVSLDCRAAVHKIDPLSFEGVFVSAKSLSIWDPARFINHRDHLVCVGSGLEEIQLELGLS